MRAFRSTNRPPTGSVPTLPCAPRTARASSRPSSCCRASRATEPGREGPGRRMRTRVRLAGALSACLVASVMPPHATHAACEGRECASLVIGSRKVPYLCNCPLTVPDPEITRAIIIIHGGYRAPEEYYAPILVALASNPTLETWRR